MTRYSPLAPRSTAPAEGGESDAEIAREALSALYRCKHPSGPAPTAFPQDELALVMRCTQECAHSDEKRAMHRLALRGAVLVSRGAPTPRFVCGRTDHFLAHVARGRADAGRPDTMRPRPAPEERPVPMKANREGWAKLSEILGIPTPPPTHPPL